MIEVRVTGEVNKPLKDLWKLTVKDFTDMGKWATGVLHSEKGENCDRVCKTPFGLLHEDILLKDEKNHLIKIDAKGMPFFVTKSIGTWAFKKISGDKTGFTVELRLETMPIIGSVMGIFMKPQVKKTLEAVASDYKIYLETGKISARKQREIDRNKK